MPRGMNQKAKMLVLKQLLERETDEDHIMSIPRMMQLLNESGVDVRDRKSVYDDLDTLQWLGMDINMRREGRIVGYYVGDRDFQLAELKLLVDAVQSSQFLTRKKTRDLICKLENLASRHQAQKLQRQVFVTHRIKQMNESIYYTVDRIHEAIDAGKQIRFHYFNWVVNARAHKLEKQLRHDGAWYCVSPWKLIWDNENYYLLAFDEGSAEVRNYRVDKMQDLTILAAPRNGREAIDRIDLEGYENRLFGMFQGKKETVRLRFRPDLVGVVVDRFGTDLYWSSSEDGQFEVSLTVDVSPQFFGWLFGLGDGVKILAPDRVAQDYSAMLDKIKEHYNEHD